MALADSPPPSSLVCVCGLLWAEWQLSELGLWVRVCQAADARYRGLVTVSRRKTQNPGCGLTLKVLCAAGPRCPLLGQGWGRGRASVAVSVLDGQTKKSERRHNDRDPSLCTRCHTVVGRMQASPGGHRHSSVFILTCYVILDQPDIAYKFYLGCRSLAVT